MMRISLTPILDTLFPPGEETLLVRKLRPEDVTRLHAPLEAHEVTALASFSSPVMRALIHEAKFRGNSEAHVLLAHLLHVHIMSHPYPGAVFVPLPLSRARMRERGYNQVERVLHALTTLEPKVSIDSSLLARVRHTRPQTELGREERLKNLQGVFESPYPKSVQGQIIIVLDDVTTTGATLREARDALLPHHPASIKLLALAH